jgi:hypothetical protein
MNAVFNVDLEELKTESSVDMEEALNKVIRFVLSKPDGVIDLTPIDSFTDDHLQCCIVDINSVRFNFMWYGEIGFLKYYKDSESAKLDLIEGMKSCISIRKGEEEEEEE